MAHVSAARVRETSTTTGTTDFALAGAVTNFRAFASVMANGDTCWYAAVLENGGWEEGFGTWVTGGTLQRTTVLSSSNSGSKVSFGAGSKDIFMTFPGSNVFHGSVTSKDPPVDADSLELWDSVANAIKRLTWANLKTALSALFARLDVEDQTLTGGARVTSKALNSGSAVTSGTLTLDPGDRPLQHYTNNGAHTLAPGSNTGSFILDITNGASAGAITTSGFTKVAGDAFTTTNPQKFRCSVIVGNAGSSLIVQAMQ